jgi:hypothetical protein
MKLGITKLNKDLAMKKTITFLACATVACGVFAKLPAPTPEQAAAADLAKAKTAYAGQVSAYQLCMSENAVANRYKTAGTPAPAACVQPPPFVAPVAAAPAPAAPAPAAAPAGAPAAAKK